MTEQMPVNQADENWYTDDRATLGDRIATARERAGLGQREAAARLGVKLATFQGWENDRAEPRSNRLQMLAGMLGVNLRWLMTGEGDGPEPDAAGLAGDLRVALSEMRNLATEQARLADRLARSERRLRQILEAAE